MSEIVNTNDEVKNFSLSATSFETFIRCISLLHDICTDVDINEGFIRQRSNDRSTIFEIDLTTIIDDCSFPILQLKDKLPLLKLLRGNDVQINLKDGDYYEFMDDFSKFKFKIPVTEYIDNKFMDLEELNSMFQLNDDDIILTTNINYTVSNRIKVVKDVYNTNNIYIEFVGDSASIYSKTESSDQSAVFIKDIPTEREINSISIPVSLPFTIDHDGDIMLEMFNYEDNISINKFSTNIESVDIVLYSRSELIDEEDDE
jgi:hypothetical protein